MNEHQKRLQALFESIDLTGHSRQVFTTLGQGLEMVRADLIDLDFLELQATTMVARFVKAYEEKTGVKASRYIKEQIYADWRIDGVKLELPPLREMRILSTQERGIFTPPLELSALGIWMIAPETPPRGDDNIYFAEEVEIEGPSKPVWRKRGDHDVLVLVTSGSILMRTESPEPMSGRMVEEIGRAQAVAARRHQIRDGLLGALKQATDADLR